MKSFKEFVTEAMTDEQRAAYMADFRKRYPPKPVAPEEEIENRRKEMIYNHDHKAFTKGTKWDGQKTTVSILKVTKYGAGKYDYNVKFKDIGNREVQELDLWKFQTRYRWQNDWMED